MANSKSARILQIERVAIQFGIPGVRCGHLRNDQTRHIQLRSNYTEKNRANLDCKLVLKWDRFSRNASESYQMLNKFKKLEIEVQAIEQPLDLNIQENKLMLAFYLEAPEVENDRRSLNVTAGLRQVLKSGEWTGVLPVGYARDKNEGLVKFQECAPLIKQGFQLVSDGLKIAQIKEIIDLLGFKRPIKAWSQILRTHSMPALLGTVF